MEDKSKIIGSAPAFLKEILPYISVRIFDLVDVPIVGMNMAKLSYQYIFSRGINSLMDDLAPLLPEGIYFENKPGISLSEKELGEALLEIYFLQVLCPGRIFLDLRPNCFERGNGFLKWQPNGLHCKMNENFKRALSDVYRGFYLNDRGLYLSGLQSIGLIADTDSDEVKEEMVAIFNEHFGASDQENVQFVMKQFVESFQKIFDKIFKQKKSLSEDFVYLGIYLVTLYLHLEKLDTSFNVRKSFFRALKKTGEEKNS